MKYYTIEQFKLYLTQQNSLGDCLYNLEKLDSFLVNNSIIELNNEDDLHDYLVDLERNQGETFIYNGDKFVVSNDVSDFIRSYGFESYSQIRTNFDELLSNRLIR